MAILSAQTLLFSQPVSPIAPCRQPSLPSTSPLRQPSVRRNLTSRRTENKKTPNLLIARASASGFDGRIAGALSDVSVLSAATGEPVLFKDLWDQNEGMSVVVLLRHFGCPCCWELASTLRDFMPRFDSAGVKLIAVGVGTSDKARILAERLPFPLDRLYADPDRKAYDTLGLYYGLSRTFFNPSSIKILSRFQSLQEATKNYTIAATPDDRGSVLQQGGVFVFKGKQLLYSRKDEGTGDHAPLDEILDICCIVPAA